MSDLHSVLSVKPFPTSIRENRSIINVSSTSGLHGNIGQANCAAGKAVLGSTKTIAKEWGRNGLLLIFVLTPLHSA